MELPPQKSPTELGRWTQGRLWSFWLAASWFLVGLIPWWLVMSWLVFPLTDSTRAALPGWLSWPLLLFLSMAAVLVPIWFFARWVGTDRYKRETAAAFRFWRHNEFMSRMGRGGSARFGDMLDEWEHIHAPDAVLLGRSLYDKGAVGLDDDRGLLTIASNRSGKGRAAIIPNLLLWSGSAVVIDPKGTNAAVTAARRGTGGGRVHESLGHDVYVLDPFDIVQGINSAAFNPLDALDLDTLTAKEDVDLLTDALVVSTGNEDSHWDESARAILAGIIVHLKGRRAQNPATLVDVRRALLQDADGLDTLFDAMRHNPAAGGVAQAAAALVGNAGDRERGSMMTTVLRHTSWLDSVAMAEIVGRRSDFTMADLKQTATTIYVVLPPDMLDTHRRFMRLFVNLTVRAAARGGKSPIPILLIMDEFYAIGPLATLAKASGALAGYGLKLWPILQNLSQLRELYPKNWQTFFANAGAVQIFGVNDRETAHEIVERLGKSRWAEKIDDRTVNVVSNLLEAAELEELTERGTGLQLVMRSGKSPLLLKKMPYDLDPLFDKAMYGPDPDHPAS